MAFVRCDKLGRDGYTAAMPHIAENRRIRWAAKEIPPPSNRAALRYEIGAIRGGAILESAAISGRWGRYSVFAASPVRTCVVPAIDDIDAIQHLSNRCRPWFRMDDAHEWPFIGGWIGYLSYEAGRFIEPKAGWSHRDARLPMAYWSLFDTVVIHDAMSDRWIVAGVELPNELTDWPRDSLEDRIDELADCVAIVDSDYQPDLLEDWMHAGAPSWNDPREAYLAKVAHVIDYIRAGDIFQANLSRRLSVPMEVHPFLLYERLCVANHATHAAYLPLTHARDRRGPAAVISSSPELFLHVKNGVVTTRPIKGTRPRGNSAKADAAAAADLATSEKDQAELNMIIDLVRNDLGRVCEYGSILVESAGDIEQLPTVYHRTATVSGKLRGDADAMDLLRAAFPGGSVTGAPKVRAMQIIDELEPNARGPYCGAIGFIGLDGSMQLNLPIRTMTMADGRVDLHVGSGVVADSTPEDEYRELQAKAAGMLRAIGLNTDIE